MMNPAIFEPQLQGTRPKHRANNQQRAHHSAFPLSGLSVKPGSRIVRQLDGLRATSLAEPVSCFPDHTLFLASPAPCCADVTPAINYYAGLDIIEVLTKCRANISGAVRSALLPRDMKQLDCDGFGNRKAR